MLWGMILISHVSFSQEVYVDIEKFIPGSILIEQGRTNYFTYKLSVEGNALKPKFGIEGCFKCDINPNLIPSFCYTDVDIVKFTPAKLLTFKIGLEAWSNFNYRSTQCITSYWDESNYTNRSSDDIYLGNDKPSSITEENWTTRTVSVFFAYQLSIRTKWYAKQLTMDYPLVNNNFSYNACGGNDNITLSCSEGLPGSQYQWEFYNGTRWIILDRTSINRYTFLAPEFDSGFKQMQFRVIPYINGVICYPDQRLADPNVTTVNVYPKKPEIYTIEGISPKCFAGKDSQIKLNINGKMGLGINSYKFSLQYDSTQNIPLSNPYIGSNDYTITNLNLSDGYNLYAGNYKVTIGNVVNDAVYCSNTFDVKIIQPSPVVIKTDALTVNDSEFNISCKGANDGKIKIKGSGGTPTYQYGIMGDTTYTTPLNYKTGEDYVFSGLKPGVPYQLHVTDANECVSYSPSITLSEPPILKSSVSLNTYPGNFNTPCFGSKDSCYLIVSGGVSPYTAKIGNESIRVNQAGEISIFSNLNADTVYSIKVIDNNNCSFVTNTSLTQPTKVEINNLDLTTCNGEGNGTATISASGGVSTLSNYTFTLLKDFSELKKVNGSSFKFADLGSGIYTVRATDRNSCFRDTTFLVPESAKPPALNDTVICKGQVLELNAENAEYTSYLWRSEFKTISNKSKATMNILGTYWLSVKNKYGCITEKSFRLRISEDLLQANFAMPSEAFAGDSIVISEISWPVPSKIDWTMPDSFYVYEKEGDLQFIKMPTRPGIYPVKLVAYLGQCWDDIEKKITIFDFSQDSLGGAAGGFSGIKTIGVYPNPNSGDFTVQVFLTDPMQVTIEVRDMFRPVPILSIQDNHKNYYSIPFDLNLVQGTYVLTVRTAQDLQSFKFVVQN